jgi:hypothetical protein
MDLVSSWFEVFDLTLSIIAFTLSIWALRVGISDRKIDIDDFNQDNPELKGKYDKHL